MMICLFTCCSSWMVQHFFPCPVPFPSVLLFLSFLPFLSTPSPPSLPLLLPHGFMSQVTEGSCALERAPCSRSSKYLSVCSLQILRMRTVWYFTAPLRWLSSPSMFVKLGKESQQGDNWISPEPFLSVSLWLDVIRLRPLWNKTLLPRNIKAFDWYSWCSSSSSLWAINQYIVI